MPFEELAASGWSHLYAERLDWALRAHRRYLEKLGEDIRGSMSGTGNGVGSAARVAVFGMIRTGKTALILALMGVRDSARVKEVLGLSRAGQTSEPSPGDIAIEYGVSPDDLWRVGEGTDSPAALTDAEAKNQLSAIRASPPTLKLRRLLIQVPSGELANDATPPADVRYFELPADDARASRLPHAVRAEARQLMRDADRVLIVCGIDQLTPLKVNGTQYPELDLWPWRPNRYLIVTTDAMSSHEPRQAARKKGLALQADDLRSRFVEQLSTTDLAFKQGTTPERQIFPLHLDALSGTMAHPADARIGEIMAQLFSELRSNLVASGDELQRLRTSLDLLGSAAALDKMVREAYQALREQERDRRRALSNKLAAFRTVRSRINERGDKLRKSHAASCGVDEDERDALQRRIRAALEPCVKASEAKDISATVSSVMTAINALAFELDRHLVAIASILDDEPDESCWHRVDTSAIILASRRAVVATLAPSMAPLRARLARNFLNDYFPILSSAYQDDIQELHRASRLATDALAAHVAAALWQGRRGQLEVEARELARCESKARRLESLEARLAQEYRGPRAEQAATARLVRQRRTQIRADGRSAPYFFHLLDEEYSDELRQRLDRITGATPGVALMELLAAHQLQEEHARLIRIAHADA